MANELYVVTEDLGNISYASDVIATLAGLACVDVEGVAGMSGGVMTGMTEMLGRKNLTKGVKVEVTDKDVKCDLNVIMEFGVPMGKVALQVQRQVKNEIEHNTGLNVLCVNVNVLGIKIDKATITAVEATADGEAGDQ